MSDEPTIPASALGDVGRDETVASDADFAPETRSRLKLHQLGNYRITRLIGEGGMGSVFEAEQLNPRRHVALKVIRPGLISPELLRRFEHEAHVLGRLQHPGIAQIFEAGTADAGHGPQPFFAMEFVAKAKSLLHYANARSLDLRARLELFARVCDAVHHAHQKGVIHRDLKPANILVGETGQPKILDFGVAKATDSDVQVTTMHTDVGQLVGTLPYMSPEQIAADPLDLDVRSDVYALGVILYELLAGRLPYEVSRKLIHEAARIIREQEATRLSSVRREYRGDIETIVAKALEKDKSRRYQSAAELAADVRRYLHSEPLVARPPSTMYQLRKFTRRNKALVGGVAATFIVLIIGAAVSIWFAIQATRQHARAENNFRAALSAVDKFFTQVSESPDLKSHGLEQLRRELLGTAKDYYDSFVADKRDDPTRQRELARANWRLGNINRELGQLRDAESAFRRATSMFERLARHGRDSDMLSDLLGCYNNLGLALADASKFSEAEKVYQQVIALEPEVAALTGDPVVATGWIASAYDNLGVLCLHTGRAADSAAAHEKGLTLRKAILSASPDEPENHNFMIVSYCNLATNFAQTGKLEPARDYLAQAIPIGEKLVAEHPGNVTYQNSLAAALNNLGGVDTLLGDNAAAKLAHQRSLAIRDAMLKAHPAVTEFALRTASSYVNLGEIDVREKRPQSGLEWLDKTIAVLDDVLRREPREATARYYECYTHSWRARALDQLERFEEAAAAWDAAIRLDVRSDPELALGRAGTLVRAGLHLLRTGQYSKAEQPLLEAERIFAHTSGATPQSQKDTAQALAELYESWNASAPTTDRAAAASAWRAKFNDVIESPTRAP